MTYYYRLPVLIALFIASSLFAITANAQDTIAYVSDHDDPGNYDIYAIVLDAAGDQVGSRVRLTTDPAIDNHPSLSHDGSKIVFSSNRLAGGDNSEGDFEIFIADFTLTTTIESTVAQLSDNNVTDTDIPVDMRAIPDRHPHFTHDGLSIIYTAKYFCIETIEPVSVSECSVPQPAPIVDPCGRLCEGIRIMDIFDLNGDNVGDNLIDIDHDDLTAANPVVWPPRVSTDARWVGHPSFSEDGSKIIFSGAVDGQGRNWEVYVADWNGSIPTEIVQLTLGSTYPDNPNPIKMSAGAIFIEDDAEVLFTSTRTEFGNSQLFVIPATSDKVPVDPSVRFPGPSDLANDYVPHHMSNERILVTSDRDPFTGINSCPDGSEPYTFLLDRSTAHTVKLLASGEADPSSGGIAIHLDGYALNGVFFQEDELTTYSAGSWDASTSPNAEMGGYNVSPGTAGEFVEIDIPIDLGIVDPCTVDIYLGATPFSGVVQILVDGTVITDGNTALPGDAGGDMSGFDLFTPILSTSNDIDLILMDEDGTDQRNITDDDMADEMLLIGDEVSWFCGLSPNLSECTYLPKAIQIENMKLIIDPLTQLPEGFPSRDLYPIAFQELNNYMSQPNPLREQNQNIWNNIMAWATAPTNIYDKWTIVVPTPINFSVNNQPPLMDELSGDPIPADGQVICGNNISAILASPMFFDPETVENPSSPQFLTYDIYLAIGDGPLLIVESDTTEPQTVVHDLAPSDYSWGVVAKDSWGGQTYGPVWNFQVDPCVGVDEQTEDGLFLKNAPNPFNNTTVISFNLNGPEDVELTIHDALGRKVRTLVDESNASSGVHSLEWDGKDNSGQTVAGGIYVCQLKTGSGARSLEIVYTH